MHIPFHNPRHNLSISSPATLIMQPKLTINCDYLIIFSPVHARRAVAKSTAPFPCPSSHPHFACLSVGRPSVGPSVFSVWNCQHARDYQLSVECHANGTCRQLKCWTNLTAVEKKYMPHAAHSINVRVYSACSIHGVCAMHGEMKQKKCEIAIEIKMQRTNAKKMKTSGEKNDWI